MSDKSSPETSSDHPKATSQEGFRFVDDYGLLICLGEGGMGEVWAARDATSTKNRIIALKTTKQQGIEAAKILYDEARIASMIDHPNVCRVHHLGRAGEVQYLVMDYCDGASLHDLLEALPNRKIPIPLACRVLASAAAGLHAAHTLADEDGTSLGVVHRDVSPQNLLISTQGIVTVTDFGVAKALGQAHKATETGEMKGKLSYMAPEQVTSKDIDARADVFALGCVLYQITLGRRPFHGDDALSTLYRLLEEELTPPSKIDPEFPAELENVIQKALAKDRDQRFQTAAEFRRALEEVLLHLDVRSTHTDVAALMEQYLGESISRRKQMLSERNEALSHFDRSKTTSSALGDSGTPRSELGNQGERTVAATQRSTRPPSKKSNNLTALLVFALVVVGGIVILTSGKEDAPDDSGVQATSPPPAVEPPTPTPSTNEAEPVTLEVAATPDDATILLDGKNVGQGKYKDEFEPSTDGHVLEVNADGYESVTRAVVFDQSQSVTIVLTKKRETMATSPRPSPKTTPKPPPVPIKKTPTKPPRKLDSDNPFATP